MLLSSPVRLVLIVVASIFVAEASIMLALRALPLPASTHGLVDPLLLVAILCPVLYLFFLRPMRAHVSMLSEAERMAAREAELATASETRYRLLHDTAFDAILVSDATDHVVDCNPSAEKMFGFAPGALLGVPLTALMPEPYRERHRAGLRRSLETGAGSAQGRVLELEGLRRGAEVFPIELMLSRFELAGVPHFSGTIRDVTERKRAAREREALQQQLNHAQRLDAIGRLAAGIAHDFSNVLGAVSVNAEVGRRLQGIDAAASERFSEILASVTQATRLTRQLLLFGRGDAFNLSVLNVNDVIERVLVMIRRLIGGGVAIVTDLAPDLWACDADEGNVEQVVVNLALNARDAMRERGTITISTSNVVLDQAASEAIADSKPGRFVCLSVLDTGEGMSPETQARLFEPFFTTKEQGKGTGLGLAVVYGIVKRHGGFITVKSAPGEGAHFRLHLPSRAAGGEGP